MQVFGDEICEALLGLRNGVGARDADRVEAERARFAFQRDFEIVGI